MDDWDRFKLRVREASDITQVVAERLTLRPKGREFIGLCPFHDDRNPSMNVVPTKQIFHCFVCGAGGDVFSFIERYHGVEFMDALRMLADRAGIEPPQRRKPSDAPASAARESEVSRHDLVDANRHALRFFRAVLEHPQHGAEARALIERRGISRAMIERFEIGAAPDRWDGLRSMAERSGWSLDALVAAGALKKKDDTHRVYDAMRNRLIFPIHGESKEPVGFGGRRIDDQDEPKYLNSPDSRLFRKSTALFGLPLARDAIRREGVAVVVEGYTDVIACHQAGVEHVVGTLGTAFTAEHARRLRGLCNRVVLLFDGDAAGQIAADRAFEVVVTAGVDVAVATLASATDAKDPDELLKRDDGPDTLRAVIARAEHASDFWGRRLHDALRGAEPAAATRTLSDAMGRLASLGLARLRPAERRMHLERLSVASGVPSDELRRSMPMGRSARTDHEHATDAADDSREASKPTRVTYLIGCALAVPDLWADIQPAIADQTPGEAMARITSALADSARTGIDALALLAEDREAKACATELLMRVKAHAGDDPERIREDAADQIKRLIADTRYNEQRAEIATLAQGIEAVTTRDRAIGGNPARVPWKLRKPRA